jgi:cell division protein FtsI/penicillin-binding protein 2
MDEEPAALPNPRPYLALSIFIFAGLFISAFTSGWWSIVRGPDLLTRTDNPRRIIEDRYVQRGMLVDRNNTPITQTTGEPGTFTRIYQYPRLAPVIGYNHPIYGESGLESSMDEYLRGVKGNPAALVWWSHLLYGMSPQGLDVRLSLDLNFQKRADEMMDGRSGAVVLMNAQTGEILAMSSSPTFDPNHLNEIGSQLNKDPGKPLINRAVQGIYPVGNMLEPFSQALRGNKPRNEADGQKVYDAFGFNTPPQLQFQTTESVTAANGDRIHISPLQAALAAAALSNHGIVPAPRIAMAVDTPKEGWIVLPAQGKSFEAVTPAQADQAAAANLEADNKYWSHIGRASGKEGPVTWFIAGTPPNWQGTPLAVVVLLEEDNERYAQWIGQELLTGAMNP